MGIPIKDILATAVQSLGLNDVAKFNTEERVLGLPKNPDDALAAMKLTDFVDEVSRESAAPGGGSIAALAGALGAALGSMVSNLSANKRGSREIDNVLNAAAEKCQEIKHELVKAVDDDANAFNAFLEARRLPMKTEQEKKEREKAMQEGLKKAISVPMETAELSAQTIEIAETVAEHGNPKSVTDVGVGAELAFAGVKGGIYNAVINLQSIKDPDFCQQMQERCAGLEKKAEETLKSVRKIVQSKLQ
jgi:glutamate formiminotransferase / formiminotetrahydrofolate cyclodeaminase